VRCPSADWCGTGPTSAVIAADGLDLARDIAIGPTRLRAKVCI
jgi:hypothetical protein